jgi:hypothetical protein
MQVLIRLDMLDPDPQHCYPINIVSYRTVLYQYRTVRVPYWYRTVLIPYPTGTVLVPYCCSVPYRTSPHCTVPYRTRYRV